MKQLCRKLVTPSAQSHLLCAMKSITKDMRLQTGKKYGQALILTTATIRDTKASIADETVLAVWLLGLYEVKNGSRLACAESNFCQMISVVLMHGRANADSPSLEEQWQAHLLHVCGAMNLLCLRGMSHFQQHVARKIFRIFKAAIVSHIAHRNID